MTKVYRGVVRVTGLAEPADGATTVADHEYRAGRTTAGSAPKRGNSEELAKIREWANANGHEVSSRGRISQAVRDAYDAAH